jgi:hypothetical protein
MGLQDFPDKIKTQPDTFNFSVISFIYPAEFYEKSVLAFLRDGAAAVKYIYFIK